MIRKIYPHKDKKKKKKKKKIGDKIGV